MENLKNKRDKRPKTADKSSIQSIIERLTRPLKKASYIITDLTGMPKINQIPDEMGDKFNE